MIKFSASYNGINPNFVIQNIGDTKVLLSPIFSIAYNILLRGCPTIPSEYLRKEWGNPNKKLYSYNYSFENCKWDYVIKGGDITNPALSFYNKTLPNLIGLNEAKTFIAECPLWDIINMTAQKNKVTQYVDFYSPLYNTVIEIDGLQHKTEKEQILKDKARDDLLKTYNVEIIRLNTENLNNLQYIKEKFKVLRKNPAYKESMHYDLQLNINEINYMLAIRLQLLFLSLYKYGHIKIDTEKVILNIYSTDNLNIDSIKISINDFYTWIKQLFLLQDVDFKIPNIEINIIDSERELSKLSGINLYISLQEVYSQTNYQNIIYIKNDYFLYENNLISKKSNNQIYEGLYKKNYYIVKDDNIKYKLNIEKHKEILTWFLRNISTIYKDFRENQLEIIIDCLNNKSIIGLLPTGAGKSLCYQIVSLLTTGMTLVIAPLQLLMIDQYDNLRTKLGITNATYINSKCTENQELFFNRKVIVTIIAPERFFNVKFIQYIKFISKFINCIVIDEAHCVSEWGHDFRTSYLCLSHNLSQYFSKDTFLIGLTGTASHRVLQDIECEFENFKGNKTKVVYAQDMRRNNLTVYIKQTDDKYKALLNLIYPTIKGINDDKTLIFTKKKRGFTDEDSGCITLKESILRQFDIKDFSNKLGCYYGGDSLSATEEKEKAEVLSKFKKGSLKVVFATKAFGMGVDIPDIRKTVHYGLPSSFESLYQEMGRAGRDGKESDCYVYFTKEKPEDLNPFFKYPLMPVNEILSKSKKLVELGTNFFFVSTSNLDSQDEKDLTCDIREQIFSSNGSFNCNDINSPIIISKYTNKQTLIEKALYKLFLLGEIEMWGLVYQNNLSNPTFVNLKQTRLNEEEKLIRLKNYIEKYQTHFNFTKENNFINRLEFLIEWTKENFLRERIQSMKTVYEQCVEFSNSEIFMDYVSNYFSNDPIYMRLLNKQTHLKDWDEVLKIYPETTKANIARLLESYNEIVPLNYISGITRLRLNEFENADGKQRLYLALNEIKKYPDPIRTKIFEITIKFLTDKQRELFIEEWLTLIKEDSLMIAKKTNSSVCQNYLIVDFINEILKVGNKLNDKLR